MIMDTMLVRCKDRHCALRLHGRVKAILRDLDEGHVLEDLL